VPAISSLPNAGDDRARFLREGRLAAIGFRLAPA
jgi:hypothetical protein